MKKNREEKELQKIPTRSKNKGSEMQSSRGCLLRQRRDTAIIRVRV